MAYIVQADILLGEADSMTIANRNEALAVAIEWASEGRSGIKIIGNDRIYTMEELAQAIINSELGWDTARPV